jgi:Spy/CpxP family protein refolding chaperone
MKLSWKSLGLAVICVTALIAITAAVVVSQDPSGRPPRGDGFRRGPGPRGGGLPFLRDLNLTDDQKAEIKKILDNEAANTKDLHDKLRALHESEPEPFSATFDEAAVRAAAEARAKIDIELQVSHAKTMSQIANVLTAEQKAQLAARKPQFREGPPPPPEP